MLSILKFIIKISLISGIAIFLGHFITYDGMTINERVGRYADRSKNATITRDIQRWAHQMKQPLSPVKDDEQEEEVEDHDQQELQKLIKKKSVRRTH